MYGESTDQDFVPSFPELAVLRVLIPNLLKSHNNSLPCREGSLEDKIKKPMSGGRFSNESCGVETLHSGLATGNSASQTL